VGVNEAEASQTGFAFAATIEGGEFGFVGVADADGHDASAAVDQQCDFAVDLVGEFRDGSCQFWGDDAVGCDPAAVQVGESFEGVLFEAAGVAVDFFDTCFLRMSW
jgi:hypothetical protein